MNISNTLAASFSLGLVTAFASGRTQDPHVQVVYPPEGVGTTVNYYFSGDASLVVAQGFPGTEIQIHIDRGDGWVLSRRIFEAAVPGPWPFGISSDGDMVGISNYSDVDLVVERGMLTLPRIWAMASGQYALYGHIYGGCVSGDGQSVAISGHYGNRTEALLWSGGDDLVNLNRERDEPDTKFYPRAMSHDGQVIAGRCERFESINDIEYTNVNHAWVYFDGSMMDIPELDFDFDVSSEAVGVSGDGHAVIGMSNARWAGQHFTPDYSWIWTQEHGTVEIADPTLFESIQVLDIAYDASIVLGSARFLGGVTTGQFLWYPDTGFVMLDELFARKGIHIETEHIVLREISDDGTKLMGLASINGQSVGLIVTLPEHGDVLSEVKRDRYIRSKLGR